MIQQSRCAENVQCSNATSLETTDMRVAWARCMERATWKSVAALQLKFCRQHSRPIKIALNIFSKGPVLGHPFNSRTLTRQATS